MDKKKQLTARQQSVYDFIVDYVTKNLYAPSFQEICDATGLKSKSSVFMHIKSLNEMGYIKSNGNIPRCITVVGYKLVKGKSR